MSRILLIIDFLNVAYRAFYSQQVTTGPRTAAYPQGEPLSVTRNLLSITHDLALQTGASNVVFAFDADGRNFREELSSSYKSGRPGRPAELNAQLTRAREAIERLGYGIFEVPGFEADDTMATLVRRGERLRDHRGLIFDHIYVATGDHDLLMTSSARTTVLDLSRGIHTLAKMTPEKIREQYKVEPVQLLELKILCGDAGDNVPGLPGMTMPVAIDLIETYGDVENVIANRDAIGDSRIAEILERHLDQIRLNRSLLTMRTDVPLVLRADSGMLGSLPREGILNYLRSLGLGDLVRTLPRARQG